MSPPLRAVLLDVYGTLLEGNARPSPYRPLLETVPAARRGETARALVTRAVPLTVDAVGGFAATYGGTLSVPEAAAVVAAVRADLDACVLRPQALETLHAMRDRGLHTCLVSNLATPYIEPIERLGLLAAVDHAVFSCHVGARKPEPEIFQRALTALHVRPDEATMIGDSPTSDVAGARRGGVPALLLGSRSLPGLADLLDALDRSELDRRHLR